MRRRVRGTDKEHSDKPSAVESRNRIAIVLGMLEKREKVVASDDTRRDDIRKKTHYRQQ